MRTGLGFHVIREIFTLHLFRVEPRWVLDSLFLRSFQVLEVQATRGSHLRHPSTCWPGLVPISKAVELPDQKVKTLGVSKAARGLSPLWSQAHVVSVSEGLFSPDSLATHFKGSFRTFY